MSKLALDILNDFSEEELEEVKKLISSNSPETIKKIEESLYRVKPPSPAEFLDTWLGPDMNIFPHIRKIFINMWDPKKDYHETILYGASRCEAKDTEILMYNLNIKKIQDIQIGDVVMGDDCTPRQVQEVVHGFSNKMYIVYPEIGKPYTITPNHCLVLNNILNNTEYEIEVAGYLLLSEEERSNLAGIQIEITDFGFVKNFYKILKVEEILGQEYYGFLLGGNHRYLHPDGLVMRNTGKSLLTQMSIVYCIVRIWCLKNPHKYYNLSRVSSMAIYLMCFSKIKAKQLLLKPIENILKASPKFHQVLFEDKIDSTQDSIGTEKIVWSTASKIGEMSFSSDIHICLASNPMDIIGANIIMAAISEINFFIEVAGISEEDVWRVYTDTKDRIQGTIANKYGSMVILDSSANIKDNLIESYILEDAHKNPKVCYNTFNRWEVMPHLFPIWNKTGKVFKVFTGDMTRPPCVIKENNFVALPGDEIKIIDVPIDAEEPFVKNIYKSLRDIAGIATSSADLFFPNLDLINELVFDENLPNISRPIETPLMVNSEDLIMSRIRHVFMEQDISGRWVLKRARSAPRWVRVDLSESSDRTGVAMCHPEIRDDGTIMCVFDFVFDIKPAKDGINLDAIKEFIRDLYLRYYIYIVGISTDKYQSSFIAQALKKDEKNYKLISVDEDKTPYLVFRSKVLNGAIKVGYYLNIYNNFRSIIETATKIDHIRLRKDSEANKNVGYESKDLLDAMAGSAFMFFNDISRFTIKYNYDDINRQCIRMKDIEIENQKFSDYDKARLYESLMTNISTRNIKASDKKDVILDKYVEMLK